MSGGSIFNRVSASCSLLMGVLALAACDIDQTPTVKETETQTGQLGPAGGGDPDYRLGPNDRMRITVFGQPTLTGEYTLDGQGVLAFPLIGNVDASGQTASELQKRIASRLDPEYLHNPSVSAEVVTRRPFYVVGEVKSPGNFPYVTDMTVLQAVAMAGGYTYRARQHKPLIKRMDTGGRLVAIEARPESRIQPGDTVEIKERLF